MMVIPKILQNSVTYSVVTVLQKGVSFLLLPIYTLYMSPADYGIMGVSLSVASLLSIFMTLSLGAASDRFYYKHKGEDDYIKKLYGTIVTLVLLNSVFMGGIFIALHKWIIDPFLGNIDFVPYVLLALLTSIVCPLYLYYQEYLQTLQKGMSYCLNSMAFFLIQVGLTVTFLTVFKWGVVGVLAANLISTILFFFYALVAFSKKFQWGIDNSIAKESMKYALPLVPHQLAAWSNGAIDKLLVNGLKTESDAGIYNLGQQYSSVMGIVTNSINRAYVPWFFDKVRFGQEGIKTISLVAEMLISIIAFVSLAMSLFGRELLDLMINNPAYGGVWKMIPLLVMGYLFQGLYFFFINILFLRNTKVVFVNSLSSMVVNIVLNIYLIPLWGCMGSALAFAVTFVFQSLVAFSLSMKKEISVRYNWKYMYSICFLSAGLSMITIFLDDISYLYAFVVKILILFLFSSFLLYRFRDSVSLLKSLIK